MYHVYAWRPGPGGHERHRSNHVSLEMAVRKLVELRDDGSWFMVELSWGQG